MRKGKIISIINQKGGIGKSTTAQSLSAGLNLKGNRVLLVDFDSQVNTTYTRRTSDSEYTIYDAITKSVNIKDTIMETVQGDMIAGSENLAKLDIELHNKKGKEYKLKEILDPIKEEYDYVIIDTPPALSTLTVNALTASNDIIITTTADIYSLQGIGQLYDTITVIKEHSNPKLNIQGILLTRYNDRTILNRDMKSMIEDIAEQIGTSVYKTFIREAIAMKEAQAKRIDIFNYAPKSNPAIDYMNFTEEVIERSKFNE